MVITTNIKQMKTRILIFIVLSFFMFTGCEKNFIEGELPEPVFKGSMWDYFNSRPKAWGLTCQLITRAGLVDLIQGKDPEYPQITFFAPTEIGLYIYLYEHGYESIDDIPQKDCKQLILSYIIPERRMREECSFEEKGTLTGGTEKYTLNDLKLRIYQVKGAFQGMEDIGPTTLGIHFKDLGFIYNVASSDLQTDNGIVHALGTENKFENPLN